MSFPKAPTPFYNSAQKSSQTLLKLNHPFSAPVFIQQSISQHIARLLQTLIQQSTPIQQTLLFKSSHNDKIQPCSSNLWPSPSSSLPPSPLNPSLLDPIKTQSFCQKYGLLPCVATAQNPRLAASHPSRNSSASRQRQSAISIQLTPCVAPTRAPRMATRT